MAFSITALGTATASGTDSQTYQRTFTPADTCVVYVHCVGRAASAPGSPTFSDTAGLTWTSLFNQTVNVTRHRIFRTIISGTSPGSITVTVDWGATILGCSMGMIQVTGGDLTTPNVALSGKSATGSGTTPAPGTVNSLADANNAQLLWVGHERATADCAPEGAGWNEIYDVANGSPAQGAAAYYRIASEDTTPTATLGGSSNWMAAANELALLVTTYTASDTGTLGESPALALNGPSEGGTLAETPALTATTSDTESGAESESFTLSAAMDGVEGHTLTDSGAVTVGDQSLSDSDSGTVTESLTELVEFDVAGAIAPMMAPMYSVNHAPRRPKLPRPEWERWPESEEAWKAQERATVSRRVIPEDTEDEDEMLVMAALDAFAMV